MTCSLAKLSGYVDVLDVEISLTEAHGNNEADTHVPKHETQAFMNHLTLVMAMKHHRNNLKRDYDI